MELEKDNMIKRIVDILASATTLCLLCPFFILVACMIKRKIGSPVIFRQIRPGLTGKPFYMFKFRTMLSLKNEAGEYLPDADRMTKFGSFLRATSLDELPELWNVLKGEMSLVGPRPLLIEYLPLYNHEQMRRHEVKPGITGWAQVKGRNAISWEEKFKLDIWYINNQSFFLDLKILYHTIQQVLARKGINSTGHATVEKFTGNAL